MLVLFKLTILSVKVSWQDILFFHPTNRLQNTASQCLGVYHQRVASVMASLMAEALDVASDNFLKLTKYDKLTALSRTLRDDPSCQVFNLSIHNFRICLLHGRVLRDKGGVELLRKQQNRFSGLIRNKDSWEFRFCFKEWGQNLRFHLSVLHSRLNHII